VSVVVPVDPGSRDRTLESGVEEEIVLRKLVNVNDGILTEVVRRKGRLEYSMLGVNLQNLGNR